MRRKLMVRTWTILGLVAATLAVFGCGARTNEPPVHPETPAQQEAPVQQETTLHPETPVQQEPQPPKEEDPAPVSSHEEDREPAIHLYKPEELLAGTATPYLSVALPPNAATHALTIQADRSTAVLYPSPWTQSSGIYVLDITKGTASRLSGPDPNGWYAYAELLPDGRMLLVGKHVWIGDPAGEQFTAVAEVGLTWLVVPSPSGRYLALWGPNARGDYTLVDLKTHEVQTRTGPFRRCAQDGGVRLAWSPDERFLAGSDCDNDATGEGARTRIVDPFTGEPVRSLEGRPIVAWLPDGHLLTQAGLPSASLLVLNSDGALIEEMAGFARPSPDGRFLIQDLNTGEYKQFLVNRSTGERVPLKLPGTLWWTQSGDIYEIR